MDTDHPLRDRLEQAKPYAQEAGDMLNGSDYRLQDTAATLDLIADKVKARADALSATGGGGREPGTGELVFWEAGSRDAAGRVRIGFAGTQLTTYNDYDPYSGNLLAIETFDDVTQKRLRYLTYDYDQVGNILQRTKSYDPTGDDNSSVENFRYDGQDRLEQWELAGKIDGVDFIHPTRTYRYAANGNMVCKSDLFGDTNSRNCLNDTSAVTHTYGTRLHAVAQAHGLGAYTYDGNGNMLTGAGRTYTWSSANKPTQIVKGDHQVDFFYRPDEGRARYKQQVAGGDTTWYHGDYERIRRADGSIEHVHTVRVDGQIVATYRRFGSEGSSYAETSRVRFLFTDALGSVDTVVKLEKVGSAYQAQVESRMEYTPWGERRGGNWITLSEMNVADWVNAAQTPRGFTGHEHLDGIGLIHMNGRVYDPLLARFVSADPHVQSPNVSGSHNRYSYVQNNPLRYSDPSGYFLVEIISLIAEAILANTAASVATAIAVAKGVVYGAVTGFLLGAGLTLANGGSIGDALKNGLRGAFWGAISGAVAGYIGSLKLHWLAENMWHGVAQGLVSELRGGEFRSGFLGAFVGHAAGRLMGKVPGLSEFLGEAGDRDPVRIARRTFAAAVIGGTAAKVGGGKFANGAISAAFAHLFNNESVATKPNSVINILYREIDGMSDEHHAYLVLQDTVSDRSYWIRGGPSSAGNGYLAISEDAIGLSGDAGSGFGKLFIIDGALAVGAESGFGTVASRSATVNMSFDKAASVLYYMGVGINSANIPYQPLSENSNAFAHQGFEALTGFRPRPPVRSRGWDTTLRY